LYLACGHVEQQKVTARELDDILAGERTQPVVVDFYATWCGPCILLAQELEMLAVEYGDRVRFLKIDTDEEHELATQMEIRGLPTLVFVSKDTEKLARRTEGLLPGDVIRDIIEKEL
jgi:thioredoxin